MKEKVKIKVKNLILSHLDGYRVIEWIGYDSDKSAKGNINEQTLKNHKFVQLIPLSPNVNIYLEESNLYRVEVELRKELIDYFHFSISQSKLVFEYNRSELSELFYEKYTCGNFFNVDEDDDKEFPLIASEEEKAKSVLYIQFKIDESEFRQFENSRNYKVKKQELKKISQKKGKNENVEEKRVLELYLAIEVTNLEFKNNNTTKNIRIELCGVYEYSAGGYVHYHFLVPSYEDLDKNAQRVELHDEFLQCDRNGDLKNVDILDLLTGLFFPDLVRNNNCELLDMTPWMKKQIRKDKLTKLFSGGQK